MRRLVLGLGVLSMAATMTGVVACRLSVADEPPPMETPRRLVDILLARDTEVIEALLPSRTTLAGVLKLHNLIESDVRALVQTVADHIDVRRLRAGQPYRLERLLDGRVLEFMYELDGDRMLQIRRHASSVEPEFDAEVVAIPKTIEVATVQGTISRETPSLIQAIDAAGEHIELSLALADVFSGEIDFNNDLQPGDTFRLVVERGTREDGAFAGYGPVLAAELVNEGRALRAVRFTPPDGKPGYFDEQGRSLKRFFLKSPLKFEPRVTSSFSRARRHPILDYTRAHNGVDYAAPTGAPVVSVAGGVVTFAGWSGGGGRTVKVRHASGYHSEYLHLSAIEPGIRTGMRVGQGQLVGRVGASGLATGPHLHYGLKRGGSYVNPVLEHRNMPPGEPVPTVHLATFGVERDRLFGLLRRDTGVRATND